MIEDWLNVGEIDCGSVVVLMEGMEGKKDIVLLRKIYINYTDGWTIFSKFLCLFFYQ